MGGSSSAVTPRSPALRSALPSSEGWPVTQVLRKKVPEGPLRAAPPSMGEAAMEPLHLRAGPTGPTTSAWTAGAQRPRPLHQQVWVLGCPPNRSLRLGVSPEAPAWTEALCDRPAANGLHLQGGQRFWPRASSWLQCLAKREHKSVSSARPGPDGPSPSGGSPRGGSDVWE